MNFKNKPNFIVLDCLRGIAALYVVINHCRGAIQLGGSELAIIKPVNDWSLLTKAHYALLKLTSLGYEFVIFFFVLSGFSIAYSLRNQQNLFLFYSKRLIRLYPPYILALIWVALIFFILQKYLPSINHEEKSVFDNWDYIINNFIYIPRGSYIPQFWSLVYEVLFYGIAPFIMLRRKLYYFISVLLYIISLILDWNATSGSNIVLKFILDYNIYFALGIYLYYNYQYISKKLIFKKAKLFAVSIFLFLTMIPVKTFLGGENKITLIVSALLAIILIINFQKLNFQTKFLRFLGAMSYTLYISHYASIKFFQFILIETELLEEEKSTNSIVWLTAVIFCIILSYGLYLIAELPTKRILQRIRK